MIIIKSLVHHHHHLPVVAVILLLLPYSSDAAAGKSSAVISKNEGSKVPSMIVFGDSSVDTGNNNQISTVLKSNFVPYGRDFYLGGRPTGRFSNGRVPADFIAEAFGLKKSVPAYLDPAYNITDFVNGVCFASAGTGYDNATSDVLNVIPMWRELEYFKEYQTKLRTHLGTSKADKTLTDALYLISLGTNDFMENYYTMQDRRSQYTIGQYQDFLVGLAHNFVTKLYSLGARKISLGGVPPLGCLPLQRTANFMGGNECVQEYNDVAFKFNDKLKGLVVKLNKELNGSQVVFSNPYYALLGIIRNPSKHGFEVASMACCATGSFEMGYTCNQFNPYTCSDASKYVFWDAFHPTEKTNQILSQHVVQNFLRHFL